MQDDFNGKRPGGPGRLRGFCVRDAVLAVAALLVLSAFALGGAPAWWAARGVTDPARAANDFAPVNQGQLKKIATEAINALDAGLPGGAGTVLLALRANLAQRNPATNDYAPVNLGQIKAAAKPIYDRLILGGLATGYPWANPANPADDFALANIGQLKALFAFSLPDAPPATQPVPAVQAAAAPPPAPAPPPSISNGDFSNVTQGSWNNAISSTEYKGGGFRWAYVAANGVPAWSALVGTKIEVWKTDAGEQFIELDGSLGNHGVKQQVKDAAPGIFLLTWKHLGRKRAAAGDNGYTVMAYTTKADGSDRKDILTPPKSFPVTTQPADAISQTAWQQQVAAFTVKPEDLQPFFYTVALPARTLWIAFDSNDNNTYGSLIDDVRLLPVEIAVDADRNGLVEFGKDTTSPQKPFRFWINDDYDLDYNENDEALTGAANNSDTTINGIRDLEDLTQVKFKIPQVLVDMAKAGTAQLGFKWKDVTSGSPSVRIWSGSPNIDKPDYLKNRNTAIQTLNQNDPLACDSDRLVSGTTSVWLRGSLMNDATGAMVNLLMEGVSVGVGKLTFMIKVGTQESEGPAIDLKLLNVRQMYERGKITVDAPDIPNPWSNPNPPALTWVWDPWNWQPDIDPNADQKTIAYVHGWRMTYNESLQWADTSFKRLWQIGYKGRFYAFRWPTYHGENNGPNPADLYKPGGTTYNPSEYRAWLSGAALANFVNGLPNGNTRYLIAHSMGNVVCGSALRNNMQVTRYAMCNSAMAAMAYDGTLKPDDPIYQTPDTDTDAGIRQTFGLANKFNPAGTEIINFSLPDDAALGQWTLNTRLFKPQLFADLTSYNYNPTLIVARRLEYENWVSHRAVTSVSEAMAYVTQSRTRAAGARQDTGGSVVSFVHLGDDAGGFGFGTEHSAEWVYSIQKTYPFWKEVLKKFDVDVTNR